MPSKPAQVSSTSPSRPSGPSSQGSPWIPSASGTANSPPAPEINWPLFQCATGTYSSTSTRTVSGHCFCTRTADTQEMRKAAACRLCRSTVKKFAPTREARLARNCSALTRWNAPLTSSQRIGQRSLATMPMLTQATPAAVSRNRISSVNRPVA
jgi:hypothetical protein